MLTLILLELCVLIYLFYKYATYKPKGFPPGPPRVPIFGCYLLMMVTDFRYLHKAVLKFSKWYKSDIVGFYVGSFPVVAVHNAKGVREVLNNSDFDGRAALFPAKMREPNHQLAGIFFQEGVIWKEQRRFILRYLRDFGFGRRFQELEIVIQEEITDMLDLIRNGPKYTHEMPYVKNGGYRILLPYFFSPFSVNNVFHIMFNERRPRSEQAKLWELVLMGMSFQRNSDDYGKLLSILPWLRHIFPNWSAYKPLMESNVFMFKYFEEIVDRYIQTYDETSERNFLDLYIREIKKAELEGNMENTTFKRNQLILSLTDFSIPAFTATQWFQTQKRCSLKDLYLLPSFLCLEPLCAINTQLSFLVQYFLLYPEVQKRIQQELDDVVGSGRLPTLEDRKYLHYTEACLREILRIETLVPSNVPHKAVCDTELMGFKIAKGTIVVTSLHAYHNDKRVWGDPENFRPERFLDDAGKLCLKKDVSFPFGAGKRLCAGETFARNMLFLMTTALCQNFNFVLGPNDRLPDLNTNLSGFIISPRDYWVQLEERM